MQPPTAVSRILVARRSACPPIGGHLVIIITGIFFILKTSTTGISSVTSGRQWGYSNIRLFNDEECRLLPTVKTISLYKTLYFVTLYWLLSSAIRSIDSDWHVHFLMLSIQGYYQSKTYAELKTIAKDTCDVVIA